MTPEQLGTLIDGMYRKYPRVDGWVFNYEYPGYFKYSKGDIEFCFTPDWDKQGEVCIQVFKGNGVKFLDGWDIPYDSFLGPDEMMTLIREFLKQCDAWST